MFPPKPKSTGRVVVRVSHHRDTLVVEPREHRRSGALHEHRRNRCSLHGHRRIGSVREKGRDRSEPGPNPSRIAIESPRLDVPARSEGHGDRVPTDRCSMHAHRWDRQRARKRTGQIRTGAQSESNRHRVTTSRCSRQSEGPGTKHARVISHHRRSLERCTTTDGIGSVREKGRDRSEPGPNPSRIAIESPRLDVPARSDAGPSG
jgi:hypothetical protein